VSLTVYGQINKGILWHDVQGIDGDGKFQVLDNQVSTSRFGFKGEAKLGAKTTAGYLMEIGVNDTEGAKGDVFEARHSAFYISSEYGRVTIGRTSMATDGISQMSLANTDAAVLTLNLQPVPGMGWGFSNLPFNGPRREILRYDTPLIQGFMASASISNEDWWDVALRYAGEFGDFRVAGGIGYRNEDEGGIFGDARTVTTGSVSVMHISTGLFLNGAYGYSDQKFDMGWMTWPTLTGYHLLGGIERKWTELGKTTLYAEWAHFEPKDIDIDPRLMGLGAIQAVDAIATDFYVTWRQIETDIPGVDKANIFMGGAHQVLSATHRASAGRGFAGSVRGDQLMRGAACVSVAPQYLGKGELAWEVDARHAGVGAGLAEFFEVALLRHQPPVDTGCLHAGDDDVPAHIGAGVRPIAEQPLALAPVGHGIDEFSDVGMELDQHRIARLGLVDDQRSFLVVEIARFAAEGVADPAPLDDPRSASSAY